MPKPSMSNRVPLRRRDILVAFALAIVLLAFAGYRVTFGVSGVYHDDAIYVLSAKALATGHGYRLTTLPGAPAQTKYPVLYPALLSVAWKLWPSFPANLLAFQLISMAAGSVAVAAAYLYLVHWGYASRAFALTAGAIAATSPSIHYFSTLTLSEMPFAVLTVGALWTLDALASRPSSSRLRDCGAGVIIAAPFLCRSVGIVVPLAGIGLLYLKSRRLSWLTSGVMLVAVPWLAWAYSANPHGDHVAGYYTDYISDWMSALPSLATVISTNLFLTALSSGILAAEGVRAASLASEWSPISTTYAWVCLLAGALIWITVSREAFRLRVLPIILLAYAAMILMWPWPPFRFLVPILPFLATYVLRGLSALVSPLIGPSIRRGLLAAAAVVILSANTACTIAYGRVSRQTGYPLITIPTHTVNWSSYERLFAWLQTHTLASDVLASGLDSMISLYTGRTAIRPFVHRPLSLFYGDTQAATGTPEEFRTILMENHVRYLVTTPLGDFAEEKPFEDVITEWLVAYPHDSRLVYADDDKRFRVFELRGAE